MKIKCMTISKSNGSEFPPCLFKAAASLNRHCTLHDLSEDRKSLLVDEFIFSLKVIYYACNIQTAINKKVTVS